MKLRYETGTATLIQFAVITILGIVTQLSSTLTSCFKHTGNCVSDSLTALIYIILLAVWLGTVSVIGYGAQEKRSRRLAQLLIAAEGMIAIIALFNARHYPNIMGLIASLIDLGIAAWIIMLAWRLMRAKGGRITVKANVLNRPRRRPSPTERS